MPLHRGLAIFTLTCLISAGPAVAGPEPKKPVDLPDEEDGGAWDMPPSESTPVPQDERDNKPDVLWDQWFTPAQRKTLVAADCQFDTIDANGLRRLRKRGLTSEQYVRAYAGSSTRKRRNVSVRCRAAALGYVMVTLKKTGGQRMC